MLLLYSISTSLWWNAFLLFPFILDRISHKLKIGRAMCTKRWKCNTCSLCISIKDHWKGIYNWVKTWHNGGRRGGRIGSACDPLQVWCLGLPLVTSVFLSWCDEVLWSPSLYKRAPCMFNLNSSKKCSVACLHVQQVEVISLTSNTPCPSGNPAGHK